jgi:hypothetical protein
MPYLVIAEEVSLLKKVGEFTDEDGNVKFYDHESVVYFMGDVIPDDDVSPVVADKYESGDAHVRTLIVACDDKGNPTDDVPGSESDDEVKHPDVVSKGGTTGSVQNTDTGEKIVSTGVSTGNRPGNQGGGAMETEVPVGGAPESESSPSGKMTEAEVAEKVANEQQASKPAAKSTSKK